MRAELRQLLAEQHPLNWRDGLKLGFHLPCLYQYCQMCGLEHTTTPDKLHHLAEGSVDTPYR